MVGGGLALLGVQVWRLIVFLKGGKSPEFDFGGWVPNVLLACAGVGVGLLIGRRVGRSGVHPPEHTRQGITIEGKAQRRTDR